MLAIDKYASRYILFNPKSAAKCLESCGLDDIVAYINNLDEQAKLALLPHLNIYVTAAFVKNLEPTVASKLLSNLRASYSASVLLTLPLQLKNEIFESIDGKNQALIAKRMRFLPNTAGTYMDSSILPFKPDDNVQDCADKMSNGSRSHYYIYVTDENDQLCGVTTMRRVFETLKSKVLLENIMDHKVDCIKVDDDAEDILRNPGWRYFHSMPVVDYNNTFLGIIRYNKIKEIQAEIQGDSGKQDIEAVGLALGELYSLGVSAFLGGAGSIVHDKGKAK